MKKFNRTDYAFNKYAQGIVYQSVKGYYEISMEDFIREDPEKGKKIFLSIKSFSDEWYHEQDQMQTRITRKELSLEEVNEQTIKDNQVGQDIQIQVEEKLIKQCAWKALRDVLDQNFLTYKQKSRLKKVILDGFTIRQVAQIEGVSHVAVLKSIHIAQQELRKVYETYLNAQSIKK